MPKPFVQYWVFVNETVYHRFVKKQDAIVKCDYLNSICEFKRDKAEVVKVEFVR